MQNTQLPLPKEAVLVLVPMKFHLPILCNFVHCQSHRDTNGLSFFSKKCSFVIHFKLPCEKEILEKSVSCRLLSRKQLLNMDNFVWIAIQGIAFNFTHHADRHVLDLKFSEHCMTAHLCPSLPAMRSPHLLLTSKRSIPPYERFQFKRSCLFEFLNIFFKSLVNLWPKPFIDQNFCQATSTQSTFI